APGAASWRQESSSRYQRSLGAMESPSAVNRTPCPCEHVISVPPGSRSIREPSPIRDGNSKRLRHSRHLFRWSFHVQRSKRTPATRSHQIAVAAEAVVPPFPVTEAAPPNSKAAKKIALAKRDVLASQNTPAKISPRAIQWPRAHTNTARANAIRDGPRDVTGRLTIESSGSTVTSVPLCLGTTSRASLRSSCSAAAGGIPCLSRQIAPVAAMGKSLHAAS